jgi:hypothetical protein
LERVYGNIELAASRVFYTCPSFTIHGGEGEDGTNPILFNGKSVKDGNIWLHPIDMGIVNDNGVIFQAGENVTNMRIIENSTDCFRKTACTTFDAYYILQNLSDNVTNISYLFNASKVNFGWDSEYDNSPHRYTFSRCGNITNVDGIFEGAIPESGCVLWSPYMDGDTLVPGLFTPLKKVKTMVGIFGLMPNVVCDRNVIRCITPDEPKYSFTSVRSFSPRFVVDDVRSIDFNLINSIKENPTNSEYIDLHGDLSGFFTDCPKLKGELINVFDQLIFINYDKFSKGGLGLSENVSTLITSIVSDYAYGELDLNLIFQNF